jgi:hypothetical protein
MAEQLDEVFSPEKHFPIISNIPLNSSGLQHAASSFLPFFSEHISLPPFFIDSLLPVGRGLRRI